MKIAQQAENCRKSLKLPKVAEQLVDRANNSYIVVLPLTGDKKAKRNAIFVLILK